MKALFLKAFYMLKMFRFFLDVCIKNVFSWYMQTLQEHSVVSFRKCYENVIEGFVDLENIQFLKSFSLVTQKILKKFKSKHCFGNTLTHVRVNVSSRIMNSHSIVKLLVNP